MSENIGNEFDVRKFDLNMYKIGTFVFNYRELEVESNKVIEIDVYKYSEPVVLYVKTYKAPFIPQATPVSVCEALYEEFYLSQEEK